VSADVIQNAAKAAWAVIKDGEPSVEINGSTANAVPQVDDWQALAGTRGPMTPARIYWKKPVKWPLDDYVFVEFTILLRFEYGATYRGAGLFIPNIWVEVPACYAGWSWDVNIGITVRNPSNANPTQPGMPPAPIARIPVTISGSVSTYEHFHHVEWGYTLFGNGYWQRDT
jgi:hypothetical protein